MTWEREQELNLRLGLFNIYLGKEYNADTPEKIFSWLQSNIKSSGFFNKRGELTELAEQDTAFINSLNTYNVALQQNIRIYKKLEMGKQKVELCNPLRIPLAANRFGLFGSRRKSSYGRLYKHQGIDIIADEGTAVYAVKDGFVVYVGNKKNGHGNQIKILHDNKVVSLYAHLKSDKVWQRTLDRYRAEGAFWMDSLTPIASVGSSGNIPKYDEQYGYAHLHLEIEIDGKSKNPFQMLNDPIQVY